MDRYSNLTTEQPLGRSENLDRLEPIEIVDLMQEEEQRVLDALQGARVELARMIEAVAERFRAGGRLFYVGAGTSGRLGMLDASECPPTFGVPRDQVQAILAGGFESLVHSVEGAEDRADAGARAVAERGVRSGDAMLGIAASSTTPFVRGALQAAKQINAYTALLTCHESPVLDFDIDQIIILKTGPEVLAGSTRLKAGTATKLFLNRLTTGAMARIGKVYRNRMVDLYLTCDKLRERALRTTCYFTGLNREEAQALLERSEGSVKLAILMQQSGLSLEESRQKLMDAEGHLRLALGE